MAALAACEGCPSENGRALTRIRTNDAYFGQSFGRIRDFYACITCTTRETGEFKGFLAFVQKTAERLKTRLRRFDLNLWGNNTELARFLRGHVFDSVIFSNLRSLNFGRSFRECFPIRLFRFCVIGNKQSKSHVLIVASSITKARGETWKI